MSPFLLPFVYVFLLALVSYLMHRHYAKRIGVERLKKMIDLKEKEVSNKLAAKSIQLDDTRQVLLVELKQFNHLKTSIERKLYSLDGKLNAMDQTSKQFKKDLVDFESFEQGLKKTIHSAEVQLRTINQKEALSKKIEMDVKQSMAKVDSFNSTIQGFFEKAQSDLDGVRSQASEDIRADIQKLENELEVKKTKLEDNFSNKIDEIRDLNEQLKSNMKEQQDNLFAENEAKIIAFFNEQVALGKEDIEGLSRSFKEREERFELRLAEAEERQQQIADKQNTFYSDFDGYKEKVAQKIVDSSDAILEAFRGKLQDYDSQMTSELEEKYKHFSKRVGLIEAELKAKEEATIQEADEQFQNIQKSIIDYRNLLSKQVQDITNQYEEIKDKLINKNQKELGDMLDNLTVLQSDFKKAESLNQVKTQKLNSLMGYVDDAQKTIERRSKDFEAYVESLNKKMNELEGDALPIVFERNTKIKKRVEALVRKELSHASQDLQSHYKSLQEASNEHLNALQKRVAEQNESWLKSLRDQQHQKIVQEFQTHLTNFMAKERKHMGLAIRELEQKVRETSKHSEEEMASLKDKYNEMDTVAVSIEAELENMQAKRTDFENLEARIKSLYDQQEKAANHIESSLKEKALEKLESLEESHQAFVRSLDDKRRETIDNMEAAIQGFYRSMRSEHESKNKINENLHEKLAKQLKLIHEDKSQLIAQLNAFSEQLEQHQKVAKDSLEGLLNGVRKEAEGRVDVFLTEQMQSQQQNLQRAFEKGKIDIEDHFRRSDERLIQLQSELGNKHQKRLEQGLNQFEEHLNDHKDQLGKLVQGFKKSVQEKEHQTTQFLDEQQKTFSQLTQQFDENVKKQDQKSTSLYQLHAKLDKQIQFLDQDKERFFSSVNEFFKQLGHEKQDAQKEIEGLLKQVQQDAKDKVKQWILREQEQHKKDRHAFQSNSRREVEAFVQHQQKQLEQTQENYKTFLKSKEKAFEDVLQEAFQKMKSLQGQELQFQRHLEGFAPQLEQLKTSFEKQDNALKALGVRFQDYEKGSQEQLRAFVDSSQQQVKALGDEQQIQFNKLQKETEERLKHFSKEEQVQLHADFKGYAKTFQEQFKGTSGDLQSLRQEFAKQMGQEAKTMRVLVESETQKANEAIKDLTYKKDKRFVQLRDELEREVASHQKLLQGVAKKYQLLEVKLEERSQKKLDGVVDKLGRLTEARLQEAEKGTEEVGRLKSKVNGLLQLADQALKALKEKTSALKGDYEGELQHLVKSHHNTFNSFLVQLKEEAKNKANQRLEVEFDKVKQLSKTLQESAEHFDSLYANYRDSIEKQRAQVRRGLEQMHLENEALVTSKSEALQSQLEALEGSLKSKEAELSKGIESRFADINAKVKDILSQVDAFVSQTNLFKKVDVLQSNLEQHLKTYTLKIGAVEKQSQQLAPLESQVQSLKTSQAEIARMAKKIALEKKDISLINKNVNSLKALSETVEKRLQSIDHSKNEVADFLAEIQTYQKDSMSIKESFAQVAESKDEVKALLKEYKQLLDYQKTLQKQHENLNSHYEKMEGRHNEMSDRLDKAQDALLGIESNQSKLVEFNEKYDQLDIALQDIAQRKKAMDKMRQQLNQEKRSIVELKKTLDEQIKVALKLLRQDREDLIRGQKALGQEEIRNASLGLRKAGWKVEEIAQHLDLEVFEVEMFLQAEDESKDDEAD